jgi:hypothetical protein
MLTASGGQRQLTEKGERRKGNKERLQLAMNRCSIPTSILKSNEHDIF